MDITDSTREAGTHDHKTHIEIDGQEFIVTKSALTGAELKALAHKDPSYQLFLETEHGEDRQIPDNETVQIKNNMELYTVPPASFG